jgi:hypothetical protein
MFEVKGSSKINRTPSDVFNFVADLNNFQKWRSNLVSSEIMTEGPTDVGSRCNEVIQMGPKQEAIFCEVTQFTSGQEFSFRADSSALIYNGHVVVEPWEDGAQFTLSAKISPNGFFKIMQPFLKMQLSKGVRQEAAAVKDCVEKE